MDNKYDFKSLDRSKRKQKIIDTAIDLFHKKGYRSTTLDDVSKRLGISKAALYHYVSSKENLLSIIYIQALENFFRDTYEISELDLSPDEKVKLIIRSHIQNIITKNLPMFAVFFSEENQLHESDFQKIREEKKKYNKIIEKIIEEGISKDLFRKADPKLQSYAIIGMCNWIYKWYNPDYSSYSTKKISDHFIDLLEKGYLKSNRQEDFVNLAVSVGASKKSKHEIKKQIYYKLKNQCRNLIKLIDEFENISKQ